MSLGVENTQNLSLSHCGRRAHFWVCVAAAINYEFIACDKQNSKLFVRTEIVYISIPLVTGIVFAAIATETNESVEMCVRCDFGLLVITTSMRFMNHEPATMFLIAVTK